MHGLSEAVLKSDSGSVTGPPRVVARRRAAEARLLQTVDLGGDTSFMCVYMSGRPWWEKYSDPLRETKSLVVMLLPVWCWC